MVAPILSRHQMPKYEPLTAIAVCLALCEVELQMLKVGYGKDAYFDAFTMIREPMKDDEIDLYEDVGVAQLARDTLQLFRCLNDWLSIFWVSPVSPASIDEKSKELDDLRQRFSMLTQVSSEVH
jgi:hypothetical protein